MPCFLPAEELLDPAALETLQRRKLGVMLEAIRNSNPFHIRRLAGLRFDAAHDPINRLPLTTREEIQADQAEHPPYGSNLTFPPGRYVRMHQTSGTIGTPVRWVDTPESWAWGKKCWSMVLRGAGVVDEDRLLFPFSFGPFIGFWLALEAAQELGLFVVTAGGMTTAARIQLIRDHRVTVVCCTPTYALRMAEAAGSLGPRLSELGVRLLIVAGEPGGSVPETRGRMESEWGARVIDHAGMTETSAWGFECQESPGGLHVIESEFIAEVIDPDDPMGAPPAEGVPGELVLTPLGRWGSPLIRYRTGDRVVRRRGCCACGRHFIRLDGGVQGRFDDMLFIRGNNVFPSAVEGILRSFPEIVEFRLIPESTGSLVDLRMELEIAAGAEPRDLAARVVDAVRERLHFRPIVEVRPAGALPRFEMKSRRVVRRESINE